MEEGPPGGRGSEDPPGDESEISRILDFYGSEMMNPEINCSSDYIPLALKTENIDFEAIAGRLQDPKLIRLLHAAMGISTEAGEILDALKKIIFYGRPLDETNLQEEQGDSFWYHAVMADVLKTTFEALQRMNIRKLQKGRYSEGFTEREAEVRDLEAERKILEGIDSRGLPHPGDMQGIMGEASKRLRSPMVREVGMPLLLAQMAREYIDLATKILEEIPKLPIKDPDLHRKPHRLHAAMNGLEAAIDDLMDQEDNEEETEK
jgi:NTP pyrophosphatase (non-canonical NTP hydrolase)